MRCKCDANAMQIKHIRGTVQVHYIYIYLIYIIYISHIYVYNYIYIYIIYIILCLRGDGVWGSLVTSMTSIYRDLGDFRTETHFSWWNLPVGFGWRCGSEEFIGTFILVLAFGGWAAADFFSARIFHRSGKSHAKWWIFFLINVLQHTNTLEHMCYGQTWLSCSCWGMVISPISRGMYYRYNHIYIYLYTHYTILYDTMHYYTIHYYTILSYPMTIYYILYTIYYILYTIQTIHITHTHIYSQYTHFLGCPLWDGWSRTALPKSAHRSFLVPNGGWKVGWVTPKW